MTPCAFTAVRGPTTARVAIRNAARGALFDCGYRRGIGLRASGGWRQMKVVEGLSKGIEPGSTVSVAELGLPVKGTSGLLLVFWKST